MSGECLTVLSFKKSIPKFITNLEITKIKQIHNNVKIKSKLKDVFIFLYPFSSKHGFIQLKARVSRFRTQTRFFIMTIDIKLMFLSPVLLFFMHVNFGNQKLLYRHIIK